MLCFFISYTEIKNALVNSFFKENYIPQVGAKIRKERYKDLFVALRI